MADISFIKDVKSLKINGEPSHEYELGSDLMRVGGVRQSPRPNNVPVFRDNGYQLNLEESNRDYISLDSDYTLAVGDSVIANVIFDDVNSNRYLFGSTIFNSFIRFSGTAVLLRSESASGFISIAPVNLNPNQNYLLEVKRTSTDFEVYVDGVFKGSVADTIGDIVINRINRRSNFYSNLTVKGFQLGSNEAVSFREVTGSDIKDDSGVKVGEIKTIHVDGNDYIEREVVQKKSFALVGNGTTEKIASPLGSDLILTSTPLEGGFTLDGKIYDFKEGLGNKIVSRDGTTESEITGFTGKSLNYGGWRKGNNVDGWIPYD